MVGRSAVYDRVCPRVLQKLGAPVISHWWKTACSSQYSDRLFTVGLGCMKFSIVICVFGLTLGGSLLAPAIGKESDLAASSDFLCASSWGQAAHAGPDRLAELSKACTNAGNVERAISFRLLSQLRFHTDRYFRVLGEEAVDMPALADMQNQWALLQANVHDAVFDDPTRLTEAWEAVRNFEPELPPFYSPPYDLEAAADEYAREFEFQYAALDSSFQPQIELLLNPDWRQVVSRMESLTAGARTDQIPSDAELDALFSRGREVAERVVREAAENVEASSIAVRVRAYGSFRPEGTPFVSEGEGAPHGLFLDFDEFAHVETVTRIPVEWGKSFGLEVELAGVPTAVPLNFEWSSHHAPLPDGNGGVLTNSREKVTARSLNGRLSFEKFYTFVEDAPVACGPWTIDLLFEGDVLVSQDFTVYGCKE